ncbi:hypothetical protein [Corallococcus macrosporus]|uniref:Lipoprotein n=1 Tax=Myxococcus fulvus (strain ATCC BAA-855 / HW-1) TaxID=483219 RepID=F8CKY0_MYXFH|nr:hypothetical protein [Corallococcus macrosporus]AEI63893.1 hypothetical protein LILAB_09910 [Corallococcus macrosporus]
MLRKASLWVLGLAGASILLCGGEATAQDTQQGPARTEQAPAGQALSSADAAALQREVDQLRAELLQLRQDVTQLRGQLAGTGGAGIPAGARVVSPQRETAAQEDPGAQEGTGGTGAAGLGSDVPPAGSNVPSPPGTAVVDAVYTGVVRSVGDTEVAIAVGEGPPLTLRVDSQTRVRQDGRNIALRKLQPGDQVRAVVDMVGEERTTEISVLPSSPAGK